MGSGKSRFSGEGSGKGEGKVLSDGRGTGNFYKKNIFSCFRNIFLR